MDSIDGKFLFVFTVWEYFSLLILFLLIIILFDVEYFFIFISLILFSKSNFLSFNIWTIFIRFVDSIPLSEFSTINFLYIFICVSMLFTSNNKFFNLSFFSSFGSILFKLLYFFIISLSYITLIFSFKSSFSFEKDADKIIPI